MRTKNNGNNIWLREDEILTTVATTGTDYFPSTNFRRSNVNIDEIAAAVKKSLGYLEKPLIKCTHCGQWGAAYCACKHCGAPIDPD